MHRRLDAFERRLAALGAVLRAWAAESARQREAGARRAVLAAMLRAGLERAGIDPGEAPALRRLETPDLPPKPFVHPLRRHARMPRPRTVVETLHAMTGRFHDGPAPDPRLASAAQLIGYYCFGAGSRAANRHRAAREAPA